MSEEVNLKERGKIHRIQAIDGIEYAIVLKHVVKLQYNDADKQTTIYLVDGSTHIITTSTSALYERLLLYISSES